jgi:hypothetical protein
MMVWNRFLVSFEDYIPGNSALLGYSGRSRPLIPGEAGH